MTNAVLASLFQLESIVELSPLPSDPVSAGEPGRVSAPRGERVCVSAPSAERDRCLKCKQKAAGAHYPFKVAARGRLSHSIVHAEEAFICDGCAGAQVRFAPLVVLCLWVPVLLVLLSVGIRLSLGWFWAMILSGFASPRQMLGPVVVLLICLALLFLIVGLVRLARRQLGAVREGLFCCPPYRGSVARLAIWLRKKDLLRSLRLNEWNALFLTEDDRAFRMR